MNTRRLIAHRGLSSRAPENTLAAFRLALDEGFDWIETDVDILGDGTPVLIHDTSLERTTNRCGRYYDLSVGELEGIDAGGWFAPEFCGEPLPTLANLVDLMNETGLNANVEIKSNEEGAARTMQLIEAVAAELERLKPGREVIVSSFNHVLLAKFKEAAPQWDVACLYETVALYDDWRSILELVGATYIHPEDSYLTERTVAAFKEAGFGINVWTVNQTARANQLFNWGVDGVISDVPHLLRGAAAGN